MARERHSAQGQTDERDEQGDDSEVLLMVGIFVLSDDVLCFVCGGVWVDWAQFEVDDQPVCVRAREQSCQSLRRETVRM